MKILLLNLYYPPDTSATAKMAATVVDALAAKHDVTVLCGRPSYDPTERRSFRLWQKEHSGRVTILRVGSTDYPRLRMRQRVLNYLTYVVLAVPGALFVPCDVVLAMTDPPFEGIVGAFVALLKRKPYVYNVRDLYPDMALGGGLIRPGLFSRVWERLHRWALRRAKRVIVLGDDMRERVMTKGVNPARVAVVRDGVDFNAARLAEVDPQVVAEIREGYRFVFLHAGNIGFYGAWETLIEAARLLDKNDSGIGLVFVGDGAERDRLVAQASGSRAVRFFPFFPAGKIPSVLAAGDVHVITVKRGLEGVVVPSKLYGILAAGRPLLVVAPSKTDAARIVTHCGCGIAVDPEKVSDMMDAARRMARDAALLQRLGEAARAAAPEYDKVLQLEKFEHVIEEAAEG